MQTIDLFDCLLEAQHRCQHVCFAKDKEVFDLIMSLTPENKETIIDLANKLKK